MKFFGYGHPSLASSIVSPSDHDDKPRHFTTQFSPLYVPPPQFLLIILLRTLQAGSRAHSPRPPGSNLFARNEKGRLRVS